jgi:hypothetical protein
MHNKRSANAKQTEREFKINAARTQGKRGAIELLIQGECKANAARTRCKRSADARETRSEKTVNTARMQGGFDENAMQMQSAEQMQREYKVQSKCSADATRQIKNE